jgi:hypothetical protein
MKRALTARILMMLVRPPRVATIVLAIGTLALFALGCNDKGYEVAEVDGVLLIDDKPGHKMLIEFIPDVDQGTTGPISTAQTDKDGRFTLVLNGGPGATTQKGAVVGQHRVTLSDLRMAESATGVGVPIRIPSDYSLSSSTPLTHEVKPGKQSIKIKLPELAVRPGS